MEALSQVPYLVYVVRLEKPFKCKIGV
jgi:hypothetical protein